MDPGKTTLFRGFRAQLDWAVNRQQVLAQNVANADTPNYRALDIKRPQFKDFLQNRPGPVKLAVTHVNHIAGVAGRSADRLRAVREPDRVEVAPSGSAVDLEAQMLKVRDTAGTYSLVLNLMRKHAMFLKLSVRRGRF
ncbi:MAG: flagellar basal body protein [Qipengyuania citrea]